MFSLFQTVVAKACSIPEAYAYHTRECSNVFKGPFHYNFGMNADPNEDNNMLTNR